MRTLWCEKQFAFVMKDSLQRELYLTRIRYWANRALQELHSIEMEIPMAQRMAEVCVC